MCRLCPIWNGCQRCPPRKEELRGRGSNSISNFHQHNINEMATLSTIHDVTGRSRVGVIYPYEISMNKTRSVFQYSHRKTLTKSFFRAFTVKLPLEKLKYALYLPMPIYVNQQLLFKKWKHIMYLITHVSLILIQISKNRKMCCWGSFISSVWKLQTIVAI
jgi:hypothetical protein